MEIAVAPHQKTCCTMVFKIIQSNAIMPYELSHNRRREMVGLNCCNQIFSSFGHEKDEEVEEDEQEEEEGKMVL